MNSPRRSRAVTASPVPQAGAPIFFQGFVEKTAKYTKSWVSRHLRLEGDEIRYATSDDSVVKATMKLVKLERFAESAPSVPSDIKDYYGMLLFGDKDEKWVIRCTSETKFEDWYLRFKTVLYRKGLCDPHNFGLPKIDDRTGIPFGKIPLRDLKTFIRLENSVIYYFGHAIFELTMVSSRASDVVVVVGDSAVYVCDSEGFIIRCVIFSQITGALWASRRAGGMLLGLATSPKPGEPDLIIRFDAMDKGKEFLRTLGIVFNFTVAAWAAMEQDEAQDQNEKEDDEVELLSSDFDDDLDHLIEKVTGDGKKQKKKAITRPNKRKRSKVGATVAGLQVDQVTESELVGCLDANPPLGYNLRIVLPSTKKQLAKSLGIDATLALPSAPTSIVTGRGAAPRASSVGSLSPRRGSDGVVGGQVKLETSNTNSPIAHHTTLPASEAGSTRATSNTPPRRGSEKMGFIFPQSTDTSQPEPTSTGSQPGSRRGSREQPQAEKMGYIFPRSSTFPPPGTFSPGRQQPQIATSSAPGSSANTPRHGADGSGNIGSWTDALAHNVVNGEQRSRRQLDQGAQPVDDMRAFLTRIGLCSSYEQHFREQGVDYDVLVTARPTELLALGVKDAQHRSRMMKEAVRLAEEAKTYGGSANYSYILLEPLPTLQSPPLPVANHLPSTTRTTMKTRFGSPRSGGGSSGPRFPGSPQLSPESSVGQPPSVSSPELVSIRSPDFLSATVKPIDNNSDLSLPPMMSRSGSGLTPRSMSNGVPNKAYLLSPGSSEGNLKTSFADAPPEIAESLLSMSFAAGSMMGAKKMAAASARAAENGRKVDNDSSSDFGLLDFRDLSTVTFDSL